MSDEIRLRMVDISIKMIDDSDDPRRDDAIDYLQSQRREILERLGKPPITVGLKTLHMTASRQ